MKRYDKAADIALDFEISMLQQEVERLQECFSHCGEYEHPGIQIKINCYQKRIQQLKALKRRGGKRHWKKN